MDVHCLSAMLRMMLEQYPVVADWRRQQLDIAIPQLQKIIGEIEDVRPLDTTIGS
jgi:hypothetical protein